MTRLLEICVDDPENLAAAIAGGADRIELCSALALGGLTPSPALVALAVASRLPTHAMVRPRGGDFIYNDRDIDLMVDEIARLADMGVAGFVVGAARADGSLDCAALTRLRGAAPRCRAVLHRAVDLTPNPCAAVSEAIDAGFDFILSSGGERTAAAGAATLAQMVAIAGSRLTMIGGSGIDPENVAALIRATGLTQVHASASIARAWPDPRIEAMGFAVGTARATSAIKVAELKRAILAA